MNPNKWRKIAREAGAKARQRWGDNLKRLVGAMRDAYLRARGRYKVKYDPANGMLEAFYHDFARAAGFAI